MASKPTDLPPGQMDILRDPAANWFTLSFRPRVRKDFAADRDAAARDAAERNALLYASRGVADITVHCPLEVIPLLG